MANLSSTTIYGNLTVTGKPRTDSIFLASGSGTNINTSNDVSWNSTDISDSSYSFDGTILTFQESGTFEITADADFVDGTQRASPNLVIQHNGSIVGVKGQSGYMRNASGHDRASVHAKAVITVSTGDTLKVQGQQGGASSTVVPDRAQLYAKRLNR